MTAEEMICRAESRLSARFDQAYHIERAAFDRVLDSFHQQRIAQRHFAPTTGYGYGDEGRDAFERVFAGAMGAQDALVRPGIASGTHALAIALFAMLRPGQTLLYASGAPYDTLHGVIGMGENPPCGSLHEYGIGYRQLELLPDGRPDVQGLGKLLTEQGDIGLVAIQRSRGYSWRNSLSLADMHTLIETVHRFNPDLPVMVDNCYGEFALEEEPCDMGADLSVGSLIKNPGGGLAPTGGYIAGTRRAIEFCEARLTAPGVGREIGSHSTGYLPYYQGLYMAPHTVCQAMMGAMLFAAVFEEAGYRVSPGPMDSRSDIIQAIELGSPEKVVAFCRAIQASSPVDAHVTPSPWAMPGYEDEVVMAAGTFISGASIELSADAPMRAPYIVYLQGGLSYAQCRRSVLTALEAVGSV